MLQMVDSATQLRGRNRLDLVITNMLVRVTKITEVTEAGILGNSDHEMIFAKHETGRCKKVSQIEELGENATRHEDI